MLDRVERASNLAVHDLSCSGYDTLVEYIRQLTHVTIGTLGPEGTSSEYSGRYFAEHLAPPGTRVEIQLFPTFEDLGLALVEGQVDLGLVPHAYAKINNFYMHPLIDLVFIYICPTPSYVLAKRPGVPIPEGPYKVTLHPATVPLLPRFLAEAVDTPRHEVCLVDATSVAARMVKEGLADLAVTNATSVARYGLEIVTGCGPLRMSWSVFRRKE